MPPLLEVRNLKVQFKTQDGIVAAVNDVSFHLERGETLGIVGESGSGKSVTSLALMRLIPTPPGEISSGTIMFDGENLLEYSEEEMRQLLEQTLNDPDINREPRRRLIRGMFGNTLDGRSGQRVVDCLLKLAEEEQLH